MLVSIESAAGTRRARLDIAPGATVGDLADALCVSPPQLRIDGISPAATQRLLHAVAPGSHLQIASARSPDGPTDFDSDAGSNTDAGSDTDADSDTDAPPRLVACGGLHSGRHFDLPAGVSTFGRGHDASLRVECPTVSPIHLAITRTGEGLVVEDAGARNGTRLDGCWLRGPAPLVPGSRLVVGAHELRLEALTRDDAVAVTPDGGGGPIPFDRPPRPASVPNSDPVAVPDPPVTAGTLTPFSWALFVGPLALGAVLALLFDPRLALFAALGPVLMLASWFESRRRARRGTRSADRRYRDERAAFERVLRLRDSEERSRLERVHPDPAEVMRMATTPTVDLWSRRPDHPAWMRLRVGRGTVAWDPPLRTRAGGPWHGSAGATRALTDAPVALHAAGAIGLCGPPDAVRAMARALVLDAVVHHGPADLAVDTATGHSHSDAAAAAWDWIAWLPHHDASGDPGHRLVVCEGAEELRPDRPGRVALDGGATVLVIAPAAHLLPSQCRAVVEVVDQWGTALVTDSRADDTTLLAAGVSVEVAEAVSRALARLTDPEEMGTARGLPERVRWLELTEWSELDDDDLAAAVHARWSAPGPPRATIGATAGGPVQIDLAADGPHALIGGTTGSGKSELLRTLVAGLAADSSPDDVTFVLVDYKGGSAFDSCAALPHVLGVVTDLDGRHGERAIRSLRAEVRRREQLMRDAGVSDLDAYHVGPNTTRASRRLARLVIVVDEFAVLARELPNVLDALVDVAQRGRSLGVHLVLATQRPAGVVNDHIRTNTNLRVALRVVEPADSIDVIGRADATGLDRRGQALLAIGSDAPRRVQVALVTAPSRPRLPVEIAWEADAPDDDPAPDDPTPHDPTPTDLERLVAAARTCVGSGSVPAHRPWLEPLPTDLVERDLGSWMPDPPRRDGLLIGVADDPDHQTRQPATWQHGDGPLLVYGMPGSGTTTALRRVATEAARRGGPVDIYVVGRPDEWRSIQASPRVGAVVAPDEHERLLRLVDRVSIAGAPETLIVIDGIRAFLDGCERAGGMALVDRALQVLATGRARVAVSSDRVAAMPPSLAGVARRLLLFRLPDPYDYAAFGVGPVDPRTMTPGRAIDVETRLDVQVIRPVPPNPDAPADDGFVAEGHLRAHRPDPLLVLPALVPRSSLPTDGSSLMLGLADTPRHPVGIEIGPGEGLLVTGPDGSGRSTALALLAVEAARTRPVVVSGADRSTLRTQPETEAWWCPMDEVEARVADRGGLVLVLDDADLVDDLDTARVMAAGAALIVAAHPERLRGRFEHWTAPLTRARFGMALHPGRSDGDLWHTTLPTVTTSGWPPGRGLLLDHGRARMIQVAHP